MENKFFFIFQALIICNGYIFTNALIGGDIHNATRGEFPAVVALAEIIPDAPIERIVFCSGVFITTTHILTYEKCFDHIRDRYYKIIGGNVNILEGEDYFPWWWTTYTKWAQLFNIPRRFIDSEIGIVKILGQAAAHIVLSPISTITPQSLLAGFQVTILGFGRTNTEARAQTLKQTTLTALSTDETAFLINRAIGRAAVVSSRYLYTKGDPYTLLTEGDSGGPVFFRGQIVAINAQTISNWLPLDHPRRINRHLGLLWYRNFILYHENF